MNDTRRKEDNGIRKYTQRWTQPTSILAALFIVGLIVSYVSNVRNIPELTDTVIKNVSRLDIVETKLEFIVDGIKEIKQLIKEH